MTRMITNFEEIPALGAQALKQALSDADKATLQKACMGASPQAVRFLDELFPQWELTNAREALGPVRVEEVEQAQAQIVQRINERNE